MTLLSQTKNRKNPSRKDLPYLKDVENTGQSNQTFHRFLEALLYDSFPTGQFIRTGPRKSLDSKPKQ